MNLEGKTIGFGLTGSHCTVEDALIEMEKLVGLGINVIPVVSDSVKNTSTRFGNNDQILNKIENITGNKVVDSIVEAEKFGPKIKLDSFVICPLTGNSMSKLSLGITDTPVLMAAKATLRNGSPLVLAVSTNDGLSNSFMNLAKLINSKNIYFVPFGQDNPLSKPNSLIADMTLLCNTIEKALDGEQIQPVLLKV